MESAYQIVLPNLPQAPLSMQLGSCKSAKRHAESSSADRHNKVDDGNAIVYLHWASASVVRADLTSPNRNTCIDSANSLKRVGENTWEHVDGSAYIICKRQRHD